MICTERHSNVVFTGFVEKSKYRKMMSNIGQYRKIGSTKGVQKSPCGSTKKHDINKFAKNIIIVLGYVALCSDIPLNFIIIIIVVERTYQKYLIYILTRK